MKKTDLLELFSYNDFKQRILNERVKDESTTVYKCGPLIDLCRGPHIRHTGKPDDEMWLQAAKLHHLKLWQLMKSIVKFG